MTRRFVLVGHPVGHSVSPAIHQAAYDVEGLDDCEYGVVDCPTEADVRQVLADMRAGLIAGANVTVPHKGLALSLADEVDSSAGAVGAANVLAPRSTAGGRIVVAHNTDVVALAEEISEMRGRATRAAVIGSGGAALAAAAACRRLGAEVVVVARGFRADEPRTTWARAPAFEAVGAHPVAWSTAVDSDWVRAISQAEVIIQATSAGMRGAGSGQPVADVVPWSSLRDDAIAYDVVYNPPSTPFFRAAVARGLQARTGLGMLVGQAAHALRIWLAAEPPRAPLRAAAEAALFGRAPA